MSQQSNERRSDRKGVGKAIFEASKETLFSLHPTNCAICGKPLLYDSVPQHPLHPTVDHIVPLKICDSKGYTPQEANGIDNCQLVHRCCNRKKGDQLLRQTAHKEEEISNRILPQHNDWTKYRAPKM